MEAKVDMGAAWGMARGMVKEGTSKAGTMTRGMATVGSQAMKGEALKQGMEEGKIMEILAMGR